MNLKNFKNIPSNIFYLSIIIIFVSLVSVAMDFTFSLLLQFYSYKIGFVNYEQLNEKLNFFLKNEDYFWPFFLIIVFVMWIVNFLLTYLNMFFTEFFILEARKMLIKRLVTKNQINLDSGLVSHYISQVIPYAASFITTLVRFFTLLIQVVFLFFICLNILPNKFLTAILYFSCLIPFVLFLSLISKRYGEKIVSQSKEINEKLMTLVKNILYIKILGLGEVEKNNLNKKLNLHFKTFNNSSLFHSLSLTLPSGVGVGIVFFLFWSFKQSGEQPSVLMSLFYLLYRFSQNLAQVFGIFNSLSVYYPNFKNFLKLSDQMIVSKKLIESKTLKLPNENNFHLMASEIGFSYPAEKDAIFLFKNINFKLNQSQMLVLKGESGSGKSTLLMALIGMFPITEGSILWNDKNINLIDEESFRSFISYVGPEPLLIKGSVYENLIYGLSEKPEENEITSACKLANIYDVINDSADGVNRIISDQGEGFSMGQKQRIALARAILRHSPILILDEITANLDSKNEEIIVENLTILKKDKLIILATHSNSFDRIADVIINLKSKNYETFTSSHR